MLISTLFYVFATMFHLYIYCILFTHNVCYDISIKLHTLTLCSHIDGCMVFDAILFTGVNMQVITYILLYLLVINLVGFALMGIDKSRARRNAWRIPEASLFLFAIFGGSIGAILGMQIFRHKTLKPTFFIGMPVILGIQVLITLYLIFLSPFSFLIM